MIRKKLLATILITTSIFSTSLPSTVSASCEAFQKFDFEELKSFSKDRDDADSLITNLQQIKSDISTHYSNAKQTFDCCSRRNSDYQDLKITRKYCLQNNLIGLLQEQIDKNDKISDTFKKEFKKFITKSYNSMSVVYRHCPSKKITVQYKSENLNLNTDKLETIFKNIFNKYNNDIIVSMPQFKGVSAEDFAKEIIDYMNKNKKLPDAIMNLEFFKISKTQNSSIENTKLTEQEKSKIIRENKIIQKALDTIKKMESQKNDYREIEESIFDYSGTIQFFIDCLEKLKLKGSLNWSDYFISDKQYNDILNKYFKLACVNNNIIKNINDSTDNLKYTIPTSEKISLAKIDNQPIELSQITASKDELQHIIVGSDVFQGVETISVGHTKYSRDAMDEIISENYKKMESFSDTKSMLKFFKASTGFEANDIVRTIETLSNSPDNLSEKYQYLHLAKFFGTTKGMFPDTWTWKDISDAITDILKPSNLKYTKEKEKIDEKSKTTEKYNYAYFHGFHKGVPIQVIVNVDKQSIVTTYPMSVDGFNEQKSRDFQQPNTNYVKYND